MGNTHSAPESRRRCKTPQKSVCVCVCVCVRVCVCVYVRAWVCACGHARASASASRTHAVRRCAPVAIYFSNRYIYIYGPHPFFCSKKGQKCIGTAEINVFGPNKKEIEFYSFLGG